MRTTILFAVLLFAVSCKRSIDYDYVKSAEWLYAKGFRVTDYLVFDKTNYYSIKGDTLLVQGKPKAIIISADKGKFDLTIQSLDGKSIGHYEDTDIAYH